MDVGDIKMRKFSSIYRAVCCALCTRIVLMNSCGMIVTIRRKQEMKKKNWFLQVTGLTRTAQVPVLSFPTHVSIEIKLIWSCSKPCTYFGYGLSTTNLSYYTIRMGQKAFSLDGFSGNSLRFSAVRIEANARDSIAVTAVIAFSRLNNSCQWHTHSAHTTEASFLLLFFPVSIYSMADEISFFIRTMHTFIHLTRVSPPRITLQFEYEIFLNHKTIETISVTSHNVSNCTVAGLIAHNYAEMHPIGKNDPCVAHF